MKGIKRASLPVLIIISLLLIQTTVFAPLFGSVVITVPGTSELMLQYTQDSTFLPENPANSPTITAKNRDDFALKVSGITPDAPNYDAGLFLFRNKTCSGDSAKNVIATKLGKNTEYVIEGIKFGVPPAVSIEFCVCHSNNATDCVSTNNVHKATITVNFQEPTAPANSLLEALAQLDKLFVQQLLKALGGS